MSDSWGFLCIIVHLERLIICHVLLNLVLILNIAFIFSLILGNAAPDTQSEYWKESK